MRLKRARLADNLNEKIAQRPGPMELVEKNILPVDSTLKQAIIGERSRHTTGVAGERFPAGGAARKTSRDGIFCVALPSSQSAR